jgi:hypothetical protein
LIHFHDPKLASVKEASIAISIVGNAVSRSSMYKQDGYTRLPISPRAKPNCQVANVEVMLYRILNGNYSSHIMSSCMLRHEPAGNDDTQSNKQHQSNKTFPKHEWESMLFGVMTETFTFLKRQVSLRMMNILLHQGLSFMMWRRILIGSMVSLHCLLVFPVRFTKEGSLLFFCLFVCLLF